jgi:hypothetical protein
MENMRGCRAKPGDFTEIPGIYRAEHGGRLCRQRRGRKVPPTPYGGDWILETPTN